MGNLVINGFVSIVNLFRSPLCQKWIAFLNKEFISFLQAINSPPYPFWSSLPRYLPSWVSSLSIGVKCWIGVLNPLNEDEKFGWKFLEIGG